MASSRRRRPCGVSSSGYSASASARYRSNKGNVAQLVQGQQARTHTIVNIMGVVGNLVCEVAQLRPQAGLLVRQKPPPDSTGFGRLQRLGVRTRAVRECPRVSKLRLSPSKRVAPLQPVHDPQALQVVLETAKTGQALSASCPAWPNGVPQIMRQRIASTRSSLMPSERDGAPELCDLQ